LALRFIAATVIRLLILDACSKAGVLTDEMAMSLIDHLCRVNECERRDAFNTFREANELWEKRSKKEVEGCGCTGTPEEVPRAKRATSVQTRRD
jgi:hypothetical protein